MPSQIPRPEYPRPQFVRSEWLNLNGEWQFEIDQGDSGLERGLLEREFKDRIQVPFCPESRLSGIANVDYLNAVWYRRRVTIPTSWGNQSVLLHFQAIDYDSTIWVNGSEIARHRGGFTPITCNLQGIAKPGDTIQIVVRARDNHRQSQPHGKQSRIYANQGCDYTRTTGIWQTVWLEPVPQVWLGRPRLTPNISRSLFHIQQRVHGYLPGLTLRVSLKAGSTFLNEASVAIGKDFIPALDLPVPPSHLHLWEPGDPFLYDLDFQLIDPVGNVLDQAQGYAGLRGISIEDQKVKINGKTVFQRLVLDQGYYPEGILTAPSDAALQKDIELSLGAGFNGARLHQKVFEERFLYHADRLGYLVWGEFPDWGCGGFGPQDDHQQPGATYITQWLEVLERDYSHPAIIGWCPLNETWQVITDNITVLDDVTQGLFLAARAMDTTRPVLDASGYSHRVRQSDIYDSHDYEQDVNKFSEHHANTVNGNSFINRGSNGEFSIPYQNQPFMVSEFGGIWWNPEAQAGEYSWGYGQRPESLAEFYTRFEGLCGVLLDNPRMFGYCYTQLTDVFQEQNGLFKFNRQPKFDLARLRAIQQRQAAIEKR
jgi:beta-galactosidase/beta-glucuronidase